jgi:hypothetical protein
MFVGETLSTGGLYFRGEIAELSPFAHLYNEDWIWSCTLQSKGVSTKKLPVQLVHKPPDGRPITNQAIEYESAGEIGWWFVRNCTNAKKKLNYEDLRDLPFFVEDYAQELDEIVDSIRHARMVLGRGSGKRELRIGLNVAEQVFMKTIASLPRIHLHLRRELSLYLSVQPKWPKMIHEVRKLWHHY